MGTTDFHREKIKELLDSMNECNDLFTKGVCLFYIAVHSIDYVLAKEDIHPNTHRGRKKLITENMDETTYTKFDQLLSASLRIRYTEKTSSEIIDRMIQILKDLIYHLKDNYSFPQDITLEITKSLKY